MPQDGKQGVNPDASRDQHEVSGGVRRLRVKEELPPDSHSHLGVQGALRGTEKSLQSSVAKALHQTLARSKAECPPPAHLSVSRPIFTHSQWLQGHELIPLACHPGCCTSAFVTQAAQPRRMETRRPTSGTLPRADFLGDELAGLCREALGPGDSLEAGGKDHSHRCRQRGCSLGEDMWNFPELGRGPSLYQFIPCICNPCLFCTTEDVFMCLMKTSFPPCYSSLGEREGERMKKGRGRDWEKR